MKDFAARLYKSKAWQKCRNGYAKSKGNLCEVCLSKGIYKGGEIVHHRVILTPENVDDPNVTLNWDNLQLVCRDCHATIHDARKRRYKFDEMGRLTTR